MADFNYVGDDVIDAAIAISSDELLLSLTSDWKYHTICVSTCFDTY